MTTRCDGCGRDQDASLLKTWRHFEMQRVPRVSRALAQEDLAARLFPHAPQDTQFDFSPRYVYASSLYRFCEHCYKEASLYGDQSDEHNKRVILGLLCMALIFGSLGLCVPGALPYLLRIARGEPEYSWYSTHPINFPEDSYKSPFAHGGAWDTRSDSP